MLFLNVIVGYVSIVEGMNRGESGLVVLLVQELFYDLFPVWSSFFLVGFLYCFNFSHPFLKETISLRSLIVREETQKKIAMLVRQRGTITYDFRLLSVPFTRSLPYVHLLGHISFSDGLDFSPYLNVLGFTAYQISQT